MFTQLTLFNADGEADGFSYAHKRRTGTLGFICHSPSSVERSNSIIFLKK